MAGRGRGLNFKLDESKFLATFIGNPVSFIERFVYGVRQADGRFLPLTGEDVKANVMNRRLEWQTKEILNAIAQYNYVAVHSGRGVTKTASDAFAILWFLYTRENSKVVVVGPKYDQMKATIWAETAKWLQRSCIHDELRWTAERIYHKDAPGLWWATILTTKQKEKIAGIHADHVLWIVDEGSDVEDDIYNTILGGMTDMEVKLLITGNLTKASGFFYKITQIEKTGWKILHFNSEDSERKNLEWFKRMQKYPRESDMYRVQVLGLPPLGNPRCIITLAQCEAARLRDVYNQEGIVPLEIGLDPAAEGNDLTAAAIRYGKKLLEVRVAAKMKAPETILWTVNIVREYRNKYKYKHKIKVKTDDTGYGNAISHYLALNYDDGIEVVPVQFGAGGNDNYADNTTTMWFNMANIIDEISLPNDDELIEELASREWIPDARNSRKVRTEPKTVYRNRLGRSPDRADACILAFWEGTKKIFITNKTNEKNNVKAFEIDWDLNHLFDFSYEGLIMGEVWHYCVIVFNDDLGLAVVMAVYEYYKNKLWIYDELSYTIPIVDVITKKIKEITRWNKSKPKIIGNYKMFKNKEDAHPLAEMFLREGLYIEQPLHYDEFGAIAQGVQMFNDDNVIIHRNLQKTRQQLNEWTIKDGKPKKEGFECCEALMIIFSEIRRQIKTTPKELPPHNYMPAGQKTTTTDNSTKWMTR